MIKKKMLNFEKKITFAASCSREFFFYSVILKNLLNGGYTSFLNVDRFSEVDKNNFCLFNNHK